MTNKTYIIAEAGVNHNGSIEIARELIDRAAEAGADAIKFQSFKTELNISKSAPKADYQIVNTGNNESQFDMVKKLEIGDDMHYELVDYCNTAGIKFLSTAFDIPSVDMIMKLGIDRMKIPSGEVNSAPLVLKMARTGLPIILSTGMCTLGDIEIALGIIAFGALGWENPSAKAFASAYSTPEGQAIIKERVTLLHCTTEYPAPLHEVNLKAMLTMKEAFDLPVGYSDHTMGITVPIAAVAIGATVIEKHFTLDQNMDGPDHKASLEPAELIAMVKGIRQVETALGHGRKILTESEKKNFTIVRRSLVAKTNIKAGDVFSEENIMFTRPGEGVPPLFFYDYMGTKAIRDFSKDEMIS